MSIRVAAYNVLADSYVKREWYPNTPDASLDPTRRRGLLVQHLRQLDADVVCMQEVEPEVHDTITAALSSVGYKSVFSKKSGRRPDGCATIYKPAVASLVRHRALHFRDGDEERGASGHVALVTEFDVGGRELGVINTHLRWSGRSVPLEQRWAYRQVGELIDDVVSARDIPWIVCGDFNVEADGPEVALLRERGFACAYEGAAAVSTCNPNQSAKKIDFLLHSAELRAEPAAIPAIDDSTPLPSESEPSDHLAISALFSWA